MNTQPNPMETPTNNAERLHVIKTAGQALALSIFPATGYNPQKIGEALADSMMQTLHNDAEIETDLGHECLSLILSAALARMNEHYEEIESKPTFSSMSFPLPSYEGEEDEAQSV